MLFELAEHFSRNIKQQSFVLVYVALCEYLDVIMLFLNVLNGSYLLSRYMSIVHLGKILLLANMHGKQLVCIYAGVDEY